MTGPALKSELGNDEIDGYVPAEELVGPSDEDLELLGECIGKKLVEMMLYDGQELQRRYWKWKTDDWSAHRAAEGVYS